MQNKNLGKKLYKSTALVEIKLFLLGMLFMLLIVRYFQTYADPDFIKRGVFTFQGVIKFYLFYPEEIISFVIIVMVPTLYYGFIRGICFYEHGIIINRGLPFFNRSLLFSSIKSYKVIHPKYLMSIERKDLDEEILFTICDPDRAVAIMDQQGINGNLGDKELNTTISSHRKFILVVFIFGLGLVFMQHFGLFSLLRSSIN